MAASLTSSHWGTYRVTENATGSLCLRGFEEDPNPSPIGQAMVETRDGPGRIAGPMVRRGFLENGAGADSGLRGQEPFVEVTWDVALDLAARELNRVRDDFGNDSIYAGSYGWASAGRFHHAQSQLRRFMNLFGGSITSRDSYSYAAAEVILPHVVAPMARLCQEHTSWRSITESGSLVVAFGGMATRNAQVNAGGTGCHSELQDRRAAHQAGVRVINISPDCADTQPDQEAEWMAIRPNTDVALMLAIAHTLVSEDLYDRQFITDYCVGFEEFLPYLMGTEDGTPKTPAWAAAITEIAADATLALARRMAAQPTLVNASWSLTRQQNGEQPYWMLVVLAALLGGIGKPGRGFGVGLGAVNGIGNHRGYVPWAALPTGKNPVAAFIPVARIADMLLRPGETFFYNGQDHSYPDARLVYWAGGNPFHHHQDLNRLVAAWQRIETVIVHEPFWTPLARRADIVLPATVGLERNDLAASSRDNYLIAMQQVAQPFAQARNDHDIFAALAERLKAPGSPVMGFKSAFTENRNEGQWLSALYRESRERGRAHGQDLPDYKTFQESGVVRLTLPAKAQVMLSEFRQDPIGAGLQTPSGRIEIYSQTVAGFHLPGLPGHPVWREPDEWLGAALTGTYPLHLITHQPERRLHSQLDHSSHSRAGKIKDREPCRMHPDDASARHIKDADLVRIFNDRGSCLSAVRLDAAIRPGVVMMATGAWYDPDLLGDPGCCKHGNPNTLTPDKPTSPLAQGPAAMSCLVNIEPVKGTSPPVTAFDPPPCVLRDRP